MRQKVRALPSSRPYFYVSHVMILFLPLVPGPRTLHLVPLPVHPHKLGVLQPLDQEISMECFFKLPTDALGQ